MVSVYRDFLFLIFLADVIVEKFYPFSTQVLPLIVNLFDSFF